jgi:acyl dehydratase
MKQEIKKNNVEKNFRITKEHVAKFNSITRDSHPLHKELTFSKFKNFSNIVINGMFISSLCIGLIMNKMFSKNFILASQKFSYHKPILINTNFKISARILNFYARHKFCEVEVKVYCNKIVYCSGNIKISYLKN